MDGAWEDSGLIQAATPPANDTRLSVSTNIVPSLTIGNTTQKSPAYLSSVVTYQGENASLVMMNTDPDTQHAIFQEENPVNPNLFHLLGGAVPNSGDSLTGVGFSCIYNSQHPSVNRGIPSAGAWGPLFLGIPHQISIYLELQLDALSNSLYSYKYKFHIVYNQEDP